MNFADILRVTGIARTSRCSPGCYSVPVARHSPTRLS